MKVIMEQFTEDMLGLQEREAYVIPLEKILQNRGDLQAATLYIFLSNKTACAYHIRLVVLLSHYQSCIMFQMLEILEEK